MSWLVLLKIDQLQFEMDNRMALKFLKNEEKIKKTKKKQRIIH